MKRRVIKRRLKIKRVVYFIIFLILLFGIICLLVKNIFNDKVILGSNKDVDDKIKIEDVIDNIIIYSNYEVDSEFLEWILKNYGKDKLLELEKKFKSNYSKDLWRSVTGDSFFVLSDKYNNKITSDSNIKIVNDGNNRVSFVGDVSLADNWYIIPEYDKREKGVYGILSEDIVDIMSSSSVMVANNEFTISDRGSKMPNKLYTFRASPTRLKIYDEMGVDLVTLANNHVYDFGIDAFYDTLKSLNEYNIPYIGAGNNLDEAMKPYYFVVNGYKIGFVNATRAEKYVLTPGAGADSPGVLRCYDPANFIKTIEKTKKVSDYVVALVHWGREDSYELENVQVETAKKYIDAGADMIVGSHAHNLQGIDFYNEKPIIYNLGDFIFNHETKDTAIFQLKINDDGSLEYYFIPCRQDDKYTYLLDGAEKLRVINNIRELSSNIVMDDGGRFYNK